ncbi:MAG: ribosome-associated translation inhibitor RaiA [Clostridia bacterium]|nr:ribosome-associated translation inhibitor RaiA [Clostridia bacterium]
MTTRFTERKVMVSEDLKAYAAKKCEKLDRYFDRDASASVTFSIERGRHTAEITVQHNGMLFRAQEQTGDMYASIDGAISSIERQIMKNKTRLEKKLRQGAFDQPAPAEQLSEEEIFDLVRVKDITLKPMTADDAILQMNLLGHQFFFFRNSDEKERHCVVYRRNNGGYGMLVGIE